MKPPFIKRVAIKNFKSIAHCDVELGSLQFLVGRNGSGKSNFLDALAFVRDMLVYDRIYKVPDAMLTLNRKVGIEKMMSMELNINLDNDTTGFLSFELERADPYGMFKVIKEECVIKKNGASTNGYRILNGEIQTNKDKQQFPLVEDNRLYLRSMRNFLEFKPLYDALCSIQVYDDKYFSILNNDIRADTAKILSSMLPNARKRIIEYLQIIVPSIRGVEIFQAGEEDQILSFIMQDDTLGAFFPFSMSNGTVRALDILTIVLQEREGDEKNFPALVCIEEPETALHARAMAGMLSALEEASEKRQVLVTTHSTEMLDNKEITADRLLPVEWRNSETVIGPLESVSKEMLNDHLTTAGELLRQNALNPEPSR